MRPNDLIAKKRDGRPLTTEEINWFIEQYTAGHLPDYQASALLMAIYLRGMSRKETVALTQAMAASGDQLDLHDVVEYAVDKHSSGGVGDKTTLAVLPIVAACGVPVAKMSGRGLGFSGGTLDKMEAIPGWHSNLSTDEFKRQVSQIGIALAGQTAQLAPADGKLYALRDVTATVSSIPLIAASIMSKKLAAGADGIVLDVKLGRGAFMKTFDEARQLAETMVNIGKDAGRDVVALLSDMNQPLGHAIGNGLEVREAILTLRGDEETPSDFLEHCIDVSGHMLVLAKRAETIVQARQLVQDAIQSGEALLKFKQMVIAQGGTPDVIDDLTRLPQAPVVGAVHAPKGGYLSGVDTARVGWVCVDLGAGRAQKGDVIDPSVGILFRLKVGDKVRQGDEIAWIFAKTKAEFERAEAAFQETLSWSTSAVSPLRHSYGTIG